MTIKKKDILEFGFGIITLFAILIICLFFVKGTYYSSIKKKSQDQYVSYYANFDDIDGLYEGSDVKIAGVNVGKLEKISINQDFQASIKINVLKEYEIAEDAMLIVATSGFLGSKYLKIIPGYKEKNLENNEYFNFTQSSLGLESLLSLFKK
jgi:phospholipid/cholesterol/gamma-HCH transport system substrate-binding protein